LEKVKSTTETNLAEYVKNSSQFMDFVEKNYEDLSKDKFSKTAYARYPEFEKVTNFYYIKISKD
jgi:hypothetical protein